MEISEIKELISQIDESTLKYLHFESGDTTLTLSKNDQVVQEAPNVKEQATASAVENAPVVAPAASAGTAMAAAEPEAQEGTIIRSQIVGVAYMQPAPGEPAYKQVGDTVEKGETVCIVEAMKLMNEIPSTVSGTVAEIYINDGEIVEYDEPLFRIV